MPPRPRGIPFHFETLPQDVLYQQVRVDASDGAESWGMLYWRANTTPRQVVYLMHPRVDFQRHYLAPLLAQGSYAVFGHANRWLNSDMDTVHETLLLDIAAAMRLLREVYQFERIILLGNSGGGSLLAFYQSQAILGGAERIPETPGGDQTNLSGETMYPGDAFISVASHQGQGLVLQGCIDPSVIDESDPLAADPLIDMYHPANGFKPLPQVSSYAPEFLLRYREAQAARVRRIDEAASRQLEAERESRARSRDQQFSERPALEQLEILRKAVLGGHTFVYRSVANPAFVDLEIDPSEREPGSIVSRRPDLANYGPFGFARVVSPRAWLSTWSSHSSNAALPKTMPSVTVPTLIVGALADSDIYPADSLAIFEAGAAVDKSLIEVSGADHFFFASPWSETAEDPRLQLAATIQAWLTARFGP
jgi:pimeloyl-ACP methyl ester carboxylesterase